MYQYSIDNNGTFPTGLTTSAQQVCKVDIADCADLSLEVLTGSYLVSLPSDPSLASTATGTNYQIRQDSGGRIIVNAPGAEQSATIAVTR